MEQLFDWKISFCYQYITVASMPLLIGKQRPHQRWTTSYEPIVIHPRYPTITDFPFWYRYVGIPDSASCPQCVALKMLV